MRTVVLLSLAATFIISTAHAAKYLVVVKDHQKFNQVHSLWTLGANNQVNRMLTLTLNQQPNFKVKNSLSHVGAMVVESDDADFAQKMSQGDVYVEKEIFHPLPRPVAGFHLTQAWDFSANQPLKRKKPKQPHDSSPADPTPAPVAPAPALDETPTASGGTPWGITAVHAPQAWDLSHKGQGARVLILDTGIDRDHPALKNNFEDGKNFSDDTNTPYEYADHEGHGTHVSGTIAGAELGDGFSGVAPQAKILMGRVCQNEGCSNVAVAEGIDWGIQEHVDVISMSLGGDFATNAEKMATQQAETAGISVVAASGNGGVNHVSYPAAFPTVIAVGAVDSKLQKADFSQWGPQLFIMAPGVAVRSSVPLGTGRDSDVSVMIDGQMQSVKSAAFMGSVRLDHADGKALVDCGLGKPEDVQGKDLTGKIALIARGEIHFSDKVKAALSAHADGVLMYNNADGIISGTATEDGSQLNIPVVMVEQAVGQKLVAALKAGQTPTAVVAVVGTDYATFDGTSMATPHVAGVVALIKATNPKISTQQVRDVLKTTATSLGESTDNEYGNGFVDAAKAVLAASQLK